MKSSEVIENRTHEISYNVSKNAISYLMILLYAWEFNILPLLEYDRRRLMTCIPFIHCLLNVFGYQKNNYNIKLSIIICLKTNNGSHYKVNFVMMKERVSVWEIREFFFSASSMLWNPFNILKNSNRVYSCISRPHSLTIRKRHFEKKNEFSCLLLLINISVYWFSRNRLKTFTYSLKL